MYKYTLHTLPILGKQQGVFNIATLQPTSTLDYAILTLSNQVWGKIRDTSQAKYNSAIDVLPLSHADYKAG